MDRLSSSTFIYWFEDNRISIHQAIDYYFKPEFAEVATMQHLTHFLVLKNYFMSFLNPDLWGSMKPEVGRLRDDAAQCTNFDELDTLRERLVVLGIDPIHPIAW